MHYSEPELNPFAHSSQPMHSKQTPFVPQMATPPPLFELPSMMAPFSAAANRWGHARMEQALPRPQEGADCFESPMSSSSTPYQSSAMSGFYDASATLRRLPEAATREHNTDLLEYKAAVQQLHRTSEVDADTMYNDQVSMADVSPLLHGQAGPGRHKKHRKKKGRKRKKVPELDVTPSVKFDARDDADKGNDDEDEDEDDRTEGGRSPMSEREEREAKALRRSRRKRRKSSKMKVKGDSEGEAPSPSSSSSSSAAAAAAAAAAASSPKAESHKRRSPAERGFTALDVREELRKISEGTNLSKQEKNRLSAKLYRERRKQYVDFLEDTIDGLEAKLEKATAAAAEHAKTVAQLTEQLGAFHTLLNSNDRRYAQLQTHLAQAVGEILASAQHPNNTNSSTDNSNTDI